jgi:hypothetical protein
LSSWHLRVVMPDLNRVRQLASLIPRVQLGVEMIPSTRAQFISFSLSPCPLARQIVPLRLPSFSSRTSSAA